MPATAPRDSVIAVVGDGFGSLLVHTTARYLGFENDQITVFGPSDNPVGTYQQFAYNLGQTVLRSESESHFLAPDWPTFAQIDALVAPVARRRCSASIRRKYNPGVPEILTEAAVGQAAHGLGGGARSRRRSGWLQREMNPTPHFVLYDEQANFIGRAKHVMLAPGPRPAVVPAGAGQGAQGSGDRRPDRPGLRAQAVRTGGRYIVLGAGIASVNEWANILDAGGSVLALTRNAQPETQDLNVPRCLFESLGIDAYTSLPFDQRIEFLGRGPAGDAPRAQEVAVADRGRPAGGTVRRDRRRDRRGRARPGRPAGVRQEQATARIRAGSTSPASPPAPASTSRC